MREKFRSYKDLMKDFDYDTTCVLVDALVCYRYNLPPMCSYAALCYISLSVCKFYNFQKSL